MATTDGAAHECARPERAAEARRAAGRQHVVGARGVVAERGRPAGADEDAAGDPAAGARLVGALEGELEVLGRERVGELERSARAPGAVTSASGASATLGRSAASSLDALGDRVEQRRRSGEITTSRPSSPCSAWAQRSSASQLGVAVPSATTTSSLGPGDPVDPDPRRRPGAWPR